MTSGVIVRASALFAALAGLVLLFTPETAMALLAPTLPAESLWLAQLLGAAWLGFASLNWHHRRRLLGGIYGRPIISANALHWFVAAMTLLGADGRDAGSLARTILLIIIAAFALGFVALLMKGPFRADLDAHGFP